MQEERSCAVAVRRIVNDLGPTERAGLLPIKPGSDAKFAEDVVALEQYRRVEVVMADWALPTTCLQLFLRRDGSVALELEEIEEMVLELVVLFARHT